MRHPGPLALLLTFALVVTVSAAAPNPPTGLTATATAYNKVLLKWTDNSSDEGGFQIFYRVGTSGNFISLTYTYPDVTEVPITGTAGDTIYQFQVRAVNATNTEQSAVAGPFTVTTPVAINNASFFSGTVGQNFNFQLTSANASLATGYSVSAPLPPGLSLNPGTGLISGVPSATGRTDFSATIQHSDGKVARADFTFQIYKPVPGLAAPVVSTAPAALSLTLGDAPATVSLTSYFADPDVAVAARLATDYGNLDFAFFPESAPLTVANFMGYVARGDYNNTFFHRSVTDFIIQGGGLRADDTASKVPAQAAVVNEPVISNTRGTVAMAKLGSNPNSATNQFFVNVADNSANLNNQNSGFTVFARVTGNGMAVADEIEERPKGRYAAIDITLQTETPVRTESAPATYNPAAMVRVLSATPLSPLSYTATSDSPAIVSTSLADISELTLTAAAPGTTTIALTATDLDGQSVSAVLPVTVLDSYASWSARQGFATPNDAEATADPDHDGLSNLEEFALATAPRAATAGIPAGRIANSHLELTFTLNTWAAGTLVTVQSATDPAGPWADVWQSTDGFSHPWIASSTLAGGVASVVARDPAALPDPLTAKKFLRLKIH